MENKKVNCIYVLNVPQIFTTVPSSIKNVRSELSPETSIRQPKPKAHNDK